MSFATKASALVLGAAALLGLAAGAAFAGVPAGAQWSASSAASDSSNVSIRTTDTMLGTLESQSLPGFRCPPGHPWLQGVDYSPSQRVPRGVQIVNSDGIDVSIPKATSADARYATGWDFGGAATNWMMKPGWLQITAHCTDDPSQGYPLSS